MGKRFPLFSKLPKKIPLPIIYSLILLSAYTSLAFLSIPTTCSEVDTCGSSTPIGTILIRPFIAPIANHPCERVPTTEFPAGVAISESLLNLLNANNFDKTKVFTDGDGTDVSKWRVFVAVSTNCDHDCEDDHMPQKYKKFFAKLDDYDIVRINSSGVPGFAISLKNVPVKRNLSISIGFVEPCAVHACNASCSPTTNKFMVKYSAGTTATNVVNGDEIRVQLIGGQGADGGNCDNCR